ncbi:arginine--tRNA ligase [Candidatus Gracilibacteria bacterium]|nr:MAG: arginine--tRNA ligase [Candidatus Gracilibacteria bacterium]
MSSFQSSLQEIFDSFDTSKQTKIEITPAPKPKLGEYCVNIFPLVKLLKKSPNEIALEFAKKMEEKSEIFTKINATGGYINFFLSKKAWQQIIQDFLKKDFLPQADTNKDKTVVVDYIGMNVGKPPHIGHICTPLLGQSMINTMRYLGYKVIGDSHLGDWGSLFGKLIVGFGKYGSEEKLETDAIDHLLEVYIKINSDCEKDESIQKQCRDAFKELSNGNPEYTALWARFTEATIHTAGEMLRMMHIHQDYDVGESFYEGIDLPRIGKQPPLQYDMHSIVDELLEKGIATKNEDGSVGVVFPEDTKMPSTILQKKDGTNLYLTSDLAAIKYRLTNGWNPDKILYFVDARQSLHFRQAFWIAKKAWKDLVENVELFHAANGAIVLPEGAMSTRKGNIIRLDSLVEEGFVRVKKLLEEKGKSGEDALGETDIREIAIGAIKYAYLMQDRERNIVFTWDKALNFEGNSGPYIQYAYVRGKKMIESETETKEIDTSQIELSPYDIALLQKIEEMPQAIEKAFSQYKPHHIASYTYELANVFNGFYVHTPKIKDEKNNSLKSLRIRLIRQATQNLRTCFDLLAIKMPNKM